MPKKKIKKVETEEVEVLLLDETEVSLKENDELKEKKKSKKKKKVNKKEKKNKVKKKKSSKKFLIFTIIFLILAIISLACAYFVINLNRGEVVEPIVTTEAEDEIERYSFSFIGVGDALLHTGVWLDARTYRYGSDGYMIYDFNHMFTHIADVIKDYDLKFYNQETIIGGKNLGLTSYPCFNSPDEIGLNLMGIGFNIVNLATNHTMDRGVKGATYSANFWQTKPEVLAVGSYRSFEERNTIQIREINGISYAMLSYTYGTNGISVPSGYEYLVNVWPRSGSAYEAYKEQVKKDVEQVRDKVDVLMVSMHWGTEYQVGKYNNYQAEAANYLASLGVDVIVGTHPHVVQPIEFIDDTLVIYSLGNFISGQKELSQKIGGIAAFTINKTVKNGISEIEITDVKADLLYTYHRNYTNYSIIPFSRLNDTILYNYRSIYEQYKPYLNTKGDSRIQVGFIK